MNNYNLFRGSSLRYCNSKILIITTVASKGSTFPRGTMQECDACGLIFGGSQVCPSCGSRISHEAEVEDNIGAATPVGELPGLNQLVNSLEGLDGMVQLESKVMKSSLPFSIGGSTGGETSLPFGVGSPSHGVADFQEEGSGISDNSETNTSNLENDDEVPSPNVGLEDNQSAEVIQPVIESPVPSNDSDSGEEVILVARIIEENVVNDVTPSHQLTDSSDTTEDEIKHFEPSSVNQDVILHEEDVVYHDFGDKMEVSEVIVDFDSFVDPATAAVSFDPSVMEGSEPELMPARALALSSLVDDNLKQQAHVGFAALAKSQWKEAASCFRTICESQPKNAAALNNFGLALLQQALLIQENNPSQNPAEEPHFEASILALRQAAKADSQDVSIMCNLATALSSCHRHQDAIGFYDAALKISENDLSSMNGRAVSCIGLRDYDAATSILRAASMIDSDNTIVSANLHRISPMG